MKWLAKLKEIDQGAAPTNNALLVLAPCDLASDSTFSEPYYR